MFSFYDFVLSGTIIIVTCNYYLLDLRLILVPAVNLSVTVVLRNSFIA